jgi:hypothetical protein
MAYDRVRRDLSQGIKFNFVWRRRQDLVHAASMRLWRAGSSALAPTPYGDQASYTLMFFRHPLMFSDIKFEIGLGG